ncbi:MAG: sigma-54-dependent Fis family transcriptional regulator [Planctomycetaceae bacterium]|nr:sigma-54-dependent Fis family transcriptional regulator [Planctomycetaceae bacterium]
MENVLSDAPVLPEMIGSCDAMRDVYRLTRQAAPTQATVLLTGETGTGKELIARAVHELSTRATGPFIRVNCAALSESLLESVLFGHIKGAFTSAHENRTGRFEAAHGGTIFLDEINSVSYKLQVKLLRVLQEHEFERVGDTRTIQVDCRVIAATNRDLLDLVEEGTFREDLYYRLNVIPIDIPPLRERTDDIPALVDHFVERYSRLNNKKITGTDRQALNCMQKYSWPGNVRELQNYIERAIVFAQGETLEENLFPPHVRGLAPVRTTRSNGKNLEDLCRDLVTKGMLENSNSDGELHQKIVSLVEKELIYQVLQMSQGTQTKAATKLGINRNTLHKKIEDYQLGDVQ